jgi:endoglucanase
VQAVHPRATGFTPSKPGLLSHVFIAVLALLLLTASAVAQNAVVRVNQLGYVTTASKRAYLMSKGAESGATFSLNAGGSSVFSAPIGADLGAWGTYLHVYALDFDSVSAPGTYAIAVSGPTAATSPSFKIDSGANVYSAALANTLSYYQNSRDGANFIGSPLRSAAAHLNDQHAGVYNTPTYDSNDNITSGPTATGATVDASGGWFDAGDYIKFVETHSYTVAVLAVGVRDFPNQMGAGSSQSDFTAEVRFGMDWLQKMWDDNSRTLYYQVGIGTGNSSIVSDHDIWRLPQQDDTWGGSDSTTRFIRNRPVLIHPGGAGAKISPNLAGRLAAGFAICYQIFKNTDPAYANQCLLSAEHVFDLANTSPSGNLITVAPFGFYGETEWRDDMELGASELYLALQPGNLPSGLPHADPNFYLTAAANWAHAYITGPGDAGDTLNLYDVSGLAHYELYRALGLAGNPGGLAVNQAGVLADFNKELGNAATQGGKDPFGFGFPWNTDDSASHGGGLSVMASEYGAMTGSNTQAAHAERWLDNILGANAWGISLIVGDGSVFPDCISHQFANIVGSLSGGSPVLSGAVVEGTNSKGTTGSISGMKACDQSARFTPFNGNGAVFVDNVQSFNTTEPAIDLTASSALAFAWQMAGSSGPTPDFAVAASPSSVSVMPGNSAAYTVSISALNGFSGTVTLGASGLPSGATASFSPGSANGSGTSTLTVTTSSSTPSGNYTLTVTGASGSLNHSASVTLSVSGPPDFSVTATPASQAVTVGSNATYTTTVSALNGFSGSVALSVSGLPSDATASFNPASVSGSGTSTLTIVTGGTTGTFPLTITGASGILTHSAAVTLTINPSTGLPAGWTDADIGGPGVAGSATYNSGVFTVKGGGADVWGTSDQFNFASTSISGDVTITARVATVQNTNTWAKAGVMLRESTAANSAYAFVMVSSGKGVAMQYRASTAAGAVQSAQTTGLVAPYWVRLVRSGSTFTGYTSADGSTWSQIGTISITMAGTISSGLAVCAHDNTQLNTSTLDNVAVSTPASPVAAPTFNPAGGTYAAAQSVTISTTTSGASIRYTTDGSTPSETAGTLYSGPVTIGNTTTLKAIAYESGMADSSVTSATYTISLPQVAAPTFSPGGGSYSSAQSVTISTATSGASIRYTTDGSTPSETAGNLYSGPVTVSSTTTLKAIAYESGMVDSAVSSATYTITLTGLPSGWTDSDIGSPSLAGSATFSNNTFTVMGSGADIYGTSDQFNYAYTSTTGDVTVTARVASQTNTHVWAKSGVMIRETTAANSAYVAVYVTPSNGIDMQYRSATGASAADLARATGIIAPYWLRLVRSGNTFTGYSSADGVTWTPTGSITVTMASGATTGLAVCSHNTAALNASAFDNVTVSTPLSQVAGPTFNPAGGTYSAAQSVTISTTTSGASIRYTTDGSTPSETAGTLYSGPVTISGTTTLKAIAYESGMADSSVTSATYTISLPQVAAPTFSPGGGNYSGAQSVTISTTTSGASIRYTTDGSTPSETAGTLYSGPVIINSATTLKAIAYESGMADSSVSSATYTFGSGPLAIAGTSESGDDGGGHTVATTLDGNFSTYWQSTTNGTSSAYVQYDLGTNHSISSVQIAWYLGNTRSTWFDVDTSTDGTTWTVVLSGINSSGTTSALETYSLASAVTARYLRYVCYGTSTDNVNAIAETHVIGQ